MYLGLLLLPWLLFFGLSGILFNHPNIGEEAHGQRIQNSGEHALQAWPALDSANEVIAKLNAQRTENSAKEGGALSLAQDIQPQWDGYAILSAKREDGQETIIWDVDKARGIWVERKARPEPGDPHFPRTGVELPQLRSQSLGGSIQSLLEAQGRASTLSLRPHPRIGPRLRLVAVDEQGQSWNLVYNSATGEVSGRKSDHAPAIGLSQLFGKLHTTHHFPMKIGARWFWALFEDLLGLSMVIWSLSGMIMWWQLKKTRRWGLVSVAAALVIAGAVMIATAQDITFGDILQTLGPG